MPQHSFRLVAGVLLLSVLVFLSSCTSGRKRTAVGEPFRQEQTVQAEAYLYDLRIVDGHRTRNGKAELYAFADTAVLRIKGYLGSLGAVVTAHEQEIGIYLPRERSYSRRSIADQSANDSCNSLWQLWPLLLRPTLTSAQLDSLRNWTIVNRSTNRQQLLWQMPLCSLTVTAKAREVNGNWYFEELQASQADGYIRLTFRERREQAMVPSSRFQPPDTTGWEMIASSDLSLELD